MDKNDQPAEQGLLDELTTARAALDDAIVEIRHSRRVDNRWLFAGVKQLQSGLDSLANATEG